MYACIHHHHHHHPIGPPQKVHLMMLCQGDRMHWECFQLTPHIFIYFVAYHFCIVVFVVVAYVCYVEYNTLGICMEKERNIREGENWKFSGNLLSSESTSGMPCKYLTGFLPLFCCHASMNKMPPWLNFLFFSFFFVCKKRGIFNAINNWLIVDWWIINQSNGGDLPKLANWILWKSIDFGGFNSVDRWDPTQRREMGDDSRE